MASLYEIVLATSYYGQRCINRWNYQYTGASASIQPSLALAIAFGAIYDDPGGYPADTVMSRIAELVNVQVAFEQIVIFNPYDPTDFFQSPFVPPYIGTIAGTPQSPAEAYGFRTNQVRRDIRRGTKRLVGVSSAQTGDGGSVVVSSGSAAADLAEMMSVNLEYDDEGNTMTFLPTIVGKEYRQVPDSSPARYAYYYYETYAEQSEHFAQGFFWEAYNRTRTQVTRQYGRGQ